MRRTRQTMPTSRRVQAAVMAALAAAAGGAFRLVDEEAGVDGEILEAGADGKLGRRNMALDYQCRSQRLDDLCPLTLVTHPLRQEVRDISATTQPNVE